MCYFTMCIFNVHQALENMKKDELSQKSTWKLNLSTLAKNRMCE